MPGRFMEAPKKYATLLPLVTAAPAARFVRTISDPVCRVYRFVLMKYERV